MDLLSPCQMRPLVKPGRLALDRKAAKNWMILRLTKANTLQTDKNGFVQYFLGLSAVNTAR